MKRNRVAECLRVDGDKLLDKESHGVVAEVAVGSERRLQLEQSVQRLQLVLLKTLQFPPDSSLQTHDHVFHLVLVSQSHRLRVVHHRRLQELRAFFFDSRHLESVTQLQELFNKFTWNPLEYLVL